VAISLLFVIGISFGADNVPPRLTGFGLTPSSINTSSGPASITLTYAATDDVALDSAGYTITNPSYPTHNLTYAGGVPFSGETSATRTGLVTFNAGSETGTWTVASIYVRDRGGNVTTLNTAQLSAAGYPTTFSMQPQVSSTISALPSALTFSFQMGSSLPLSKSVTVASNTATAFTSSAGGGSWLSVVPPSGTAPANLSVSVNPVGLNPGTYNGTVAITAPAASNSPTIVPVSLVITSAPTISVSPSLLSFAYQSGGDLPKTQAMTVAAVLATAFSASAAGGNWLSVSPFFGSTPATLSISVNPNGLAAGTYAGSITISSQSASNSPITVPVNLVVMVAPTLSVVPSALSFSYQTAGATPGTQNITVGSTASVSFTVTTAGGSWLSLTPLSGSAPATLAVSVNPGSLSVGTYTGAIAIASPGASKSPQTVSVILVVTAAPVLTVAPASLSFSYQAGGAVPGSQSIAVKSTAPTSFTATATGGNWISVTPFFGSTPATLTVLVNPVGLSSGTFTGSVTIVSPDSSNSPVSVPVTLAVTGAPMLSVEPASLEFTFAIGGAAPSSQTISVSGTTPILFSASAAGGNWFSVLPPSGTTSTVLRVSVDPSVLSPGRYVGSITIAAQTAPKRPAGHSDQH
jgi:hypothetical protein